MRSTEDLPGTLVLLRPSDQPHFHNKIGTILSELSEDNTVLINLGKPGTITLPITALFVLRDPEEIEKFAGWDQSWLTRWTFADIMEVAKFANSALKEERIVAIEISSKDPEVFEYTMNGLNYELGIGRSNQISR